MKAYHRTLRDWLAAVLSCLVILSLSVTLVAAHSATVTSSDPADEATLTRSPAQVIAQFDEELDTGGSTMKVMDAAGKQVSEGNGKVDLNDPEHQKMIALLPKPLADGVYTVQWHALLTDGDATDGAFKFTVKSEPAPTQAVSQAAATTPTPTPTAVSTAVPTASPTSGAVATIAAPAAAAPNTLPMTGAGIGDWAGWLGACLLIALIAFGLLLFRRDSAR